MNCVSHPSRTLSIAADKAPTQRCPRISNHRPPTTSFFVTAAPPSSPEAQEQLIHSPLVTAISLCQALDATVQVLLIPVEQATTGEMRRGVDITSSIAGLTYPGTVIHLASRRVVGWAQDDHVRTEMISDALRNAFDSCHPR